MTRLSKQIVAALLGVGTICGTLSDAQACGGRGGSGGGYRPHRVSYAQPVYRQQYPQQFAQYPPQPQQPWVGAPQTVHPQFAQQPQQQVFASSGQGQLPPAVRRVNSAPAGPQFQAQQGQGQFQGQVQVQGGAQRQTAMRPVSGQVNAGQAEGGALESLGGMPTQQVAQRQTAGVSQLQQFQGQQAQQLQQPQQGQQSLQGQQPVQQQQLQQQPQQQLQQQQPQQQLQQQQPSEQQEPMSDAQQSALNALAGMGDEEPSQATTFTEEAQPASTESHVGQWKATLGNGSTIELTLQPNGSFVWVANTNGKASSFEGNYMFENGSLTLIRSSDNQKLAGSLTPIGNGGVNFKLNGSKDNGVNFSRG